ncbi:hypothetical protein GCM10009838_63640 [Catenulispora subtropica]|uniref:Uncharacterized protein n=1 Tax=Catenulispora subtropica TaxID=450798 RepID=A0ABN2SRX0_9ACTN
MRYRLGADGLRAPGGLERIRADQTGSDWIGPDQDTDTEVSSTTNDVWST